MSGWLALLALSSQTPAPSAPPAADRPQLLWADLDRDGLDDAYVLRPGASDRLLRNLGHGAFAELAAETLHGERRARAAAFADLDGDGWIDLVLVDGGGELRLLENTRSFAFEDVTAAAGLGALRALERVSCVDFDHDGRPDLELGGAGRLLVLRNAADGTFTPVPELCVESPETLFTRFTDPVVAASPLGSAAALDEVFGPAAGARGALVLRRPASASVVALPGARTPPPLDVERVPQGEAPMLGVNANGRVPTGYLILGDKPAVPHGYSATGRTLAAQEGDAWSAGAAMPFARKEFQAAALDGKVYAPGGRDDSFQVLDSMLRYDPSSDSWSACATMPRPRWAFCAAALAGKVVLLGGSSGVSALLEVDAYDPLSDSWSQLAPLSITRFFGAAAVLGGKLYVFGGNPGGFLTDSVEAYDPLTGAWSPRAPMPSARQFHSATAVGGRIYVVGGTTGPSPEASVDVYDPLSDSWSSGVPMPSGLQLHSAVELNGNLYVLGGFTSTVLEFLPAQGAWLTRAPMFESRVVFGAAVANGRAYAFGGNPGPALASLEVYDPGVLYAFRKN